jgi:hypothetical protein
MLHFSVFAKRLLSIVHLKFFSAYIHFDVVKSSELSIMHEDVKFISFFGVTAQKLNMNILYIKP